MKVTVIILLLTALCSCTQAPPPALPQKQTSQEQPEKKDERIEISHKGWAP